MGLLVSMVPLFDDWGVGKRGGSRLEVAGEETEVKFGRGWRTMWMGLGYVLTSMQLECKADVTAPRGGSVKRC